MLIVFALVLTLFLTQTGDAVIATISENDEIGMAAIKALAFYALGFFFCKFQCWPPLLAAAGLPSPINLHRPSQRQAALSPDAARRLRRQPVAPSTTRLCARDRADADVRLGQPGNTIKG